MKSTQGAGNEQKAHKLRDGNGNDKECPPHLLQLHQLVVDENRQQHPENIVREGREDRPDDRPAKDTEEGVGFCLIAKEDIRHIGKPRPGKELAGRLMGGVEVCEGDQHHEHDRKHREGHQAKHRGGQQRNMEMEEKAVAILPAAAFSRYIESKCTYFAVACSTS
ncbi:MAG: hypothetical protein K6G66_07480 [Oscillospiraceae bacterium]|nr:hypothetical protein [Oscillospiraceae bacterium]